MREREFVRERWGERENVRERVVDVSERRGEQWSRVGEMGATWGKGETEVGERSCVDE